MRNIAYILTLLCLSVFSAGAQSFYTVTHGSGIQVIGGVNVTAIPLDGGQLYPPISYCGAGPYYIGQLVGAASPTTGYKFTFSKAISAARFRITASDSQEVISFRINDSAYSLMPANVTNFGGSCGNQNGWYISSGGSLMFSGYSNNNSEVFIADSIVSVTITNVNIHGGSVVSFHFVMDTTTHIEKMADSVFCVGDSMHLEYTATGTYFSNNQFKFLLSDKNGNFSSPTLLGTINGTTSGVFHCIIPPLPSGDGYRIRIASSNPVDTSQMSHESIGIGNPPSVLAYNTGPGCEGDTLKVGVHEFSNVTERTWNGPGLQPNFLIRIATLYDVKMSDSGMYYVMVEDNGCFAYDSTLLVIKPNPVHTTSATNSPVCEGDTLRLQGNIDSAGVVNTWFTQSGTGIVSKDIVIAKANLADSGRYILATKLNGCTAKDTAYVVVKPTPVPNAATNSPLCAGGKLLLETDSKFLNVQYIWNGPGGFSSIAADTSIENAVTIHSGKYTVRAYYNGCGVTDTLDVNVKPMPPLPALSGRSPICETEQIEITAANIITTADYTWDGPNKYTGTGYSVVVNNATPAAGGVYTLKANINGCSKEAAINVVVNPLPILPQITSNSPLRIGKDLQLGIVNPEQGTSYSWQGPNGFMSYDFNPVIKRADKHNNGTYTLLAERKGCLRSGLLQVIVDEVTDTGMIILYPNANDGEFYVKALVNADQPVHIRITNAAGQTVYRESTVTVNKLLFRHLNLKDALASGVYSFSITFNGDIKVIPFVVDRQR